MRVQLAVKLVEYELERFPLLINAGWRVRADAKAKRRLGLCNYRDREIVLSESFVQLNDPPKVRECGLHEIAHALVGPGHGHDIVWQAQASRLGIEPTRCDSDAAMPIGKYVAVCPTCSKVYSLYKAPKPGRVRWCRKCGRFKGDLKFILAPAIMTQ